MNHYFQSSTPATEDALKRRISYLRTGWTNLVPDTENYKNVSALASSVADNDIAHEIGHQFQLTHHWFVSSTNLMCSLVCPSHAGSHLAPDQIDTAKKNAKLLAE